MKKKLIVMSGLVLGLAPIVALAQTAVADTCARSAGTNSIETVICRIGSILNTIIPFLIVLAVIYFIWGVITYVIGSDEEAKKEGRNKIIAGIIGLAVIVGVWGLVRILNNTFNPSVGGPIPIPCILGTPGC
jgi:large-conductance mechanosensitive channel